MNRRKIAMLASSLMLVGGTMVATTNAFAAEGGPAGTFRTTFQFTSSGVFIGEACVVIDATGKDACATSFAGQTATLTLDTQPGRAYTIKGSAAAGNNDSFTGTTGQQDETICAKFSGTTFIGFKFRKIGC